MKINLLCDKYGIEHKNSMIDIELGAIQRIAYSLSIETQKNKENTLLSIEKIIYKKFYFWEAPSQTSK